MKKYVKPMYRVIALLVALIMALTFTSCIDSTDDLKDIWDSLQPDSDKDGGGQTVVAEGDIEIHFLELGNKYTGDCTYIKAGDNDILIDAGSRASSIETIDDYISRYVTDGTLEYVIVTHAHQDHYAGFATYENQQSLFDLYECEVIIDFSQIESGKEDGRMYQNYIRERNDEIAAGAVHYPADKCVEMGGKFDLGDGITLTILDSYYYYNRSSNENDHSVCTLLSDGQNNYLFTGDLEKKGEEKLVEMNDLPEVKLYKAGHHGSKTSSNDCLLSVIKPEIVCVCCCCGSSEYTDVNENQFPTQAFIDRIAPYTDKVYVTTLCVDYDDGVFTSMNGNIVVRSVKGEVSVSCSASNTILKDSEWFASNRTTPNAWK